MKGVSYFVIRIGQHRIGRVDYFPNSAIHRRQGGDGHRRDLGSGVLEGLVVLAQLNQLRSVWSSPASLEEDQDDRSLL